MCPTSLGCVTFEDIAMAEYVAVLHVLGFVLMALMLMKMADFLVELFN